MSGMAESLVEQLDRAIDAIVTNAEALPAVSAGVEPLTHVALKLCYLPSESFKARLKHELYREAEAMMQATEPVKAAQPTREGLHTVTPYLAVKEVYALIDFVKQVFDARGQIYGTGSEGGIHSEYTIGDSIVMIGGGEAWRGTPMPTALHIYVDDVDAVYQRALDAGASSMNEPLEDHGERVGGVKDSTGNEWYIAKRLEGSHTAEGLSTVNVYLHPQGAAEMIEFLKPAFGAEEIVAYRERPDGPVVHAKVRIGDSVVEMGEAHGPFQPMPTMFYLNVDDADAWYNRAMAAGATSMGEPKDQPYGSHVGGVKDPFDNIWYLATQIPTTK